MNLLLSSRLPGEQQRSGGRSVRGLRPPAGERHHERPGAQSEEGLPLSSTLPPPNSSWRHRAGGEHLQPWWGHLSSRHEGSMSSFIFESKFPPPPPSSSSRLEVAGLLPLLGSRLCSSGFAGMSVPPGGALHACLQEGSGGQCPGGRLAGADHSLLPQRLVAGGLLRLLGHAERLVWCSSNGFDVRCI